MSGIMESIQERDPGEHEFHQAVEEVMDTVKPVLDRNPEYVRAGILQRLTEPDRVITFRVPWIDDEGRVR
ncbi:MAG: glutamate dehydrogenase, partial [Deltaproteobacteria bacterium]|nr:glutamate dehydrogenase [Deltaproteobacteria bacterium]